MLNENIRTLRKSKGLSQEELAIKLNVVRQTVSKWEKGLSVPDAGMLIKIAEALETTVNVLLGEAAPEPEEDECVKNLAAKLELLNEQLAKRSERRRRVLRVVFVVIGLFALSGVVEEVLLQTHLHQVNEMFESSATIIGGTDKATAIFVSGISHREWSILKTVIAGTVAVFGIHYTRRK